MIHLSGNKLGLVMIVASAPVAALGSLVFKWPDGVTMAGVGIVLIAMDLAFRVRSRARAGWLTNKELGGYVYFLPIWGAGIVIAAANVINMVFGPFGK